MIKGVSVDIKEIALNKHYEWKGKIKDVDELVKTIYIISGSFEGINLEDVAPPRCFEVERQYYGIKLTMNLSIYY